MESCPPTPTECLRIGILVTPTVSPPQTPATPTIPARLLAVMKKYEYNWRLAALARPKTLTNKFVPKPPGFIPPRKSFPKLSNELAYFADQLSKPKLRNLYINQRLFGGLTRRLSKKFAKNIDRTWGTIYNFYKKRERERQLRQLRQKQKETKDKQRDIDEKIIANLARPKTVFFPEPTKKSSKIFSNFDRLDELAVAKPSHLLQPPLTLPIEISRFALTYEPTDNVIKLAKPPARFMNLPQPLEPGKVRKSALRYTATERIGVLAQPKQRSDKARDDEGLDRWVISKGALKYKPSQRILELAKPIERD